MVFQYHRISCISNKAHSLISLIIVYEYILDDININGVQYNIKKLLTNDVCILNQSSF